LSAGGKAFPHRRGYHEGRQNPWERFTLKKQNHKSKESSKNYVGTSDNFKTVVKRTEGIKEIK
jgi:hypothetical protein